MVPWGTIFWYKRVVNSMEVMDYFRECKTRKTLMRCGFAGAAL